VLVRTLIGAFTVVFSIGVASGLQAQPACKTSLISLVHAGATSETFVSDLQQTGNLFGVDSAGPISANASSSDGGSGTATAEISNGVLGAYATGFNSGASSVSVDFEDTLTLVSDTLPPGTPVQIAFNLGFNYGLTGSSCSSGVARVEAFLSAVGLNPTQDIGSLSYKDDSCVGVTSNNTSGVFQASIGQDILVSVGLRANAVGAHESGTLDGLPGTATASALNALRFFADPQGPFTYVSACENNYASLSEGDIIVTDFTVNRVARVNPVNGAQTTILDLAVNFNDVAVAADKSLFVAAGPDGVLKVDPATGSHSVVSAGGVFVNPFGIDVGANGDLLVSDEGVGVVRVHPVTGTQHVLSARVFPDSFSAIATSANDAIYVIANDSLGETNVAKILRIDHVTGAQELVSAGGELINSISLTVSQSGDIFATAIDHSTGAQQGKVIHVDPLTGTQSVLSSGILVEPTGIDTDGDGNLLVADFQNFQPVGGSIVRVDRTTGAQTVIAVGEAGGPGFRSPFRLAVVKAVSAPPAIQHDLFLHGSGSTANPPTLFLDESSPTATTAKYKDSAGVNFSGGNLWKEVGTWHVTPASLLAGNLTEFGGLNVWLGLKNSDDQGTRFDVKADVLKNGELVGSGLVRCIIGVTRNANQAKEIDIELPPPSLVSFDGSSDVLSLKLSTRIGTNSDDTKCGGHNNAAGLRLYFDAATRLAKLGVTLTVP
jgi:streptogramin lyase